MCQLEGMSIEAINSREVLTYRVDALRQSLPLAVELLADTSRRPKLLDEEYARAKVSESIATMHSSQNCSP